VPEYIVKDNTKYRVISNHLGSPVRVVNLSNNEVVKSIKYDTFGNIINESGAFELPFRFAGGLYDEDTKLVRFGVRDYDSQTGRWTSKEPLGFSGARNWYVYAGNDGVNYVDINGLYFEFDQDLNPSLTYNEFEAMLNQIASINNELFDMINYLRNSPFEINITGFMSAPSKCSPKLEKIDYAVGIVLNFRNKYVTGDGVIMNPLEVLAHELTHAKDVLMGAKLTKREYEKRAVRVQNMIRKWLGFKKSRTRYADWDFRDLDLENY